MNNVDSFDSHLFAGTMLWPSEVRAIEETLRTGMGICVGCGREFKRSRFAWHTQRYCREWLGDDGLNCFERHRIEYFKRRHHERHRK